MRVLIIASSFPPYNAIASLRPYSWAKYWSKWGHDVTVLTTKKIENVAFNLNLDCSTFKVIEIDYMSAYPLIAKHIGNPETKLPAPKTNGGGEKQRKSVIRSIASYLFANSGAISNDCRMPNTYQLWVGAACSYMQALGEHYDVAVSTFAPFASLQIGYRLKKKGVVEKLVFDYRDLWIESPFKGVFGFRWLERVFEKKWIKEADAITTVSQPLADVLSSKYQREVRVVLNGVDLDDLKAAKPNDILDNSKINIMYAGSLYANLRDPEPLFKALSELKEEGVNISRIKVSIATGSPDRTIELINMYNLSDNAEYIGMLPRQEVLYMQSVADIVLFLAHNGEGGEGFLGGKLSELLFSGTYIWVIGKRGQPSDIIEGYGCGKHLGNDVFIIKENIKALLAGPKPNVPNDMTEKAKVFTREYQAENLLSLISEFHHEK